MPSLKGLRGHSSAFTACRYRSSLGDRREEVIFTGDEACTVTILFSWLPGYPFSFFKPHMAGSHFTEGHFHFKAFLPAACHALRYFSRHQQGFRGSPATVSLLHSLFSDRNGKQPQSFFSQVLNGCLPSAWEAAGFQQPPAEVGLPLWLPSLQLRRLGSSFFFLFWRKALHI